MKIKTLLNSLSFISLILLSASSQAMSLTTYRIYLDSENNNASFLMFNKSTYTESCEIKLVHIDYDVNGVMKSLPDDVIPSNSAEPWIRYTPKSFTAPPRETQTVRFTLRRKANAESAEYRSYLNVNCEEVDKELPKSKSDGTRPEISVKPRLVQNIPIVVRTGKLDAQVSFSDFSRNGNKIHFTIHRQGTRSIYGNVELIDKATGEVINYRKNVSLYTETKQLKYDLTIPTGQKGPFAVRFDEDEKYGGELTYQQDVVSN